MKIFIHTPNIQNGLLLLSTIFVSYINTQDYPYKLCYNLKVLHLQTKDIDTLYENKKKFYNFFDLCNFRLVSPILRTPGALLLAHAWRLAACSLASHFSMNFDRGSLKEYDIKSLLRFYFRIESS